MTGLVLKLGPNERVLINGAVIENGNRRSRLNIVTKDAKILRLRDAIHPSDTNTPVRRLCYMAQLILSGDTEMDAARSELLIGIGQLRNALIDADSQTKLADAQAAAEAGEAYRVLKSLRGLIDRERMLLEAVPK